MNFLNPEYSLFLIIILLSLPVYVLAEIRKSRFRAYFAPSGSRVIFPERLPILAGIILAVMALMRPVSHPREQEVQLKGRDIVFLVDVSRSMLAEDLVPSRLDRTRFDIEGAMNALYGNRVGLVAFAGDAVLKCPLTTDYGFFLQTVRDLSVNSVTRGGSSIGDAIRFAIDQFYRDGEGSGLDIFLITDGEDQNTFPLEAAEKAGDLGISLISIALGDPEQGAIVPDTQYRGSEVYSVPDADTLKAIAERSGSGLYLSVPGGAIDFSSLIGQISSREKSTGNDRYTSYSEHYLWFLIPGFLLVTIGVLMRRFFPERRPGQ